LNKELLFIVFLPFLNAFHFSVMIDAHDALLKLKEKFE